MHARQARSKAVEIPNMMANEGMHPAAQKPGGG
jgi:hypothetical protein